MVVLKAENLYVQYFKTGFFLRNVSLSVRKGELLLVTGPSGSGKTTLLYSLSGIIPHCIQVKRYNGNVYMDGVNVREVKFSELSSKFGIVLQNPTSQIFGMTVEEDIVFGLENLCFPRDEIEARLNYVLRFMGLEKYRTRDPLTLSGGEKQKLVIGSVLAMDPEIMFLDEPTSNLDPEGAKDVLSTLIRLKNLGKTLIIVERRIERISPYVDRIIALKQGRIVMDAGPREFFFNRSMVEELGVNPPPTVKCVYGLIDRKIPVKNVPLTLQEFRLLVDKLLNGVKP